jgi:hypothetical protein
MAASRSGASVGRLGRGRQRNGRIAQLLEDQQVQLPFGDNQCAALAATDLAGVVNRRFTLGKSFIAVPEAVLFAARQAAVRRVGVAAFLDVGVDQVASVEADFHFPQGWDGYTAIGKVALLLFAQQCGELIHLGA